MNNDQTKQQRHIVVITILLFLFIIARIASIYFPGTDGYNIRIWAMSYNIVAVVGAIYGIFLSKSWGGFKSVVGRASLVFSIGLLLQSFGQNVYNFLYITQGFDIQPPYPGLGDVGFFGSVIFYIYGAILLAKISGVKVSLDSFIKKLQALFIPVLVLAGSYHIFLKDYAFDFSNKLKIVLDLGYPLGQAFYVSIVVLTFILTRKILGGLMRTPIIWFLWALVAQYAADFMFLYQANNGTFTVGGLVDCMYLVSYFLMAMSLIKLGNIFRKINNS